MKKSSSHGLVRKMVVMLIVFYQHTASIFLGPCCRFTPSCSSYALQSILRFGILGGVWLIFKRLSKCHPLHPGGYDPVPETING